MGHIFSILSSLQYAISWLEWGMRKLQRLFARNGKLYRPWLSIARESRQNIQHWLIRLAYKLGPREPVYDWDGNYCCIVGERCTVCKYCGSPTQATDITCWRCR